MVSSGVNYNDQGLYGQVDNTILHLIKLGAFTNKHNETH